MVSRGGHVENVHHVNYVVVSTDSGITDSIVDSGGDHSTAVFGRSATKPLQALPLVTTGAAAAFELAPAHLALACASHNGEDAHVELVTEWLDRIGCSVDDLECGVMQPFTKDRAIELAASGVEPDARHHMCSGKHAGFLTVARHLGYPTVGYSSPDHPVQAHVRAAIEELTTTRLDDLPLGVDGCSVPTHATPLEALARGVLPFAPTDSPPQPGDTATRLACAAISAAMSAYPFLVAGTNRLCTEAMQASAGRLVCKVGADGVYVAAARPETGQRFALALKVKDGSTRAAESALVHLLARRGIDLAVLDPRLAERAVVRNIADARVGEIRVLTNDVAEKPNTR